MRFLDFSADGETTTWSDRNTTQQAQSSGLNNTQRHISVWGGVLHVFHALDFLTDK